MKLIFVSLLIAIPVTLFGQERQRIDRTRPTKKSTTNTSAHKPNTESPKSYFTISSTIANFDSKGGTKTFTVNSSGSWKISTDTYTWGHLERNGNILTLRVDENQETSSRTDYFVLMSGSKTLRVNITQTGGVTLSVSLQDLSFTSTGGTQTISISTNDTWTIGTDTYSWGHLNIDGNFLHVKVDENTETESRTDYFTIKAGNQEKRVNITQAGAISSWGISGTSRTYTDNAPGLSYIVSQIKEKGECRLGAITEYGKGVVIYGSNGYSYSSIPNSFNEKLKEINGKGQKISSVTLTNSGYYCITFERNGWYGVVPENMKSKLHEFNNNGEEIFSVSICENGNFAIVTDKHYFASHTGDFSNMKKACDLYGSIKNVCITNLGICVVCQNGIYYSNIPTKLEERLKSIDYHPDHVTYTDSGTFLITTESGSHSYFM